MLRPGSRAPDFVARTLQGKVLYLSQLRGKPFWLIFYRYPRCPFCNLHFVELLKRMKSFRNIGLDIVCVFETASDKFNLGEKRRKSLEECVVVPDPQHKIYQQYYVRSGNNLAVFRPAVAFALLKAMFRGFFQGKISGRLRQLPAHFFVDEKGLIEFSYYGRHIADHISWDIVDEFVKSRQPKGQAVDLDDEKEEARPEPMAPLSPSYLFLVSPPEEGKMECVVRKLETPSKPLVLGREGDLAFPDDLECAPKHLELIYGDQQIWVYDLNSATGTFINGRRIPTLEPVTFLPGCILRFGAQIIVHSYSSEFDPTSIEKPIVVGKHSNGEKKFLDIRKIQEKFGTTSTTLPTPKSLVEWLNSTESTLTHTLIGDEDTLVIPSK